MGLILPYKRIELRTNALDLTDRKLGRLKVLIPIASARDGVTWLCQCSCGNLTKAKARELNRGDTRSCGCLKKDVAKISGKKRRKRFNKHTILGDTTVIRFYYSDGRFKGRAFVDTEDLPILKKYRWNMRSNGYVFSSGRIDKHHLGMHRVLMLDDPINNPYEIDHIDNNPANNRKSNLRVCSRAENSRNRKTRYDSTTSYKGVALKQAAMYHATIGYNGKKVFIGNFATPEEAAQAYNKKAIELYGKYAKLNDLED